MATIAVIWAVKEMILVSTDIENTVAENQQKRHTYKHYSRPGSMRVHLDAAYQQTEHSGIEQGILKIETPTLNVGRIVRQMLPRHEESHYPDRYIDGEEPGPFG